MKSRRNDSFARFAESFGALSIDEPNISLTADKINTWNIQTALCGISWVGRSLNLYLQLLTLICKI